MAAHKLLDKAYLEHGDGSLYIEKKEGIAVIKAGRPFQRADLLIVIPEPYLIRLTPEVRTISSIIYDYFKYIYYTIKFTKFKFNDLGYDPSIQESFLSDII